VLVFSTNRFYRKNYKSVRFVEEEIVERGLRCIFTTQNIDTADTKQWRMTLQFHGMMDENNATCYAENIRAAHQGLSRERIVVGTIPFGYRGEPIPGRLNKQKRPQQLLVIDETASKYVIQIFEWFVIGLVSIDEIVRRLIADPLVLPPPKSPDKKWTRKSVRGVLTNCRYRGFLPYGESESRWQSKADYARQFRREVPLQLDHFEELRLVSDDIWFRAQARLQNLVTNRGRKSKRRLEETISRVLNGLFVCEVHGRQLYAGGANGGVLYCKDCRELPANKRLLFTLWNRRLALRLFADKIRDLLCAGEGLVGRIIQAC
jgi:site-specific DNA recombinase